MNEIRLNAYAKINLGLDVLRRRSDGYHEVCMIMQTVRIYDKLAISKKDSEGFELRTNLPYLPTGSDNLCCKAAGLLFDEFSIPGGVSIFLNKHIPVAAGMAGGSADAAAVLYGLNRMYSLGLSTEELMKRAVKLGADVPYCVMRGTALAEGIGEKLTRLPAIPDCRILAVRPGISVSTRYVYENLHVDTLPRDSHPDIEGIAGAIKRGDLHGMAGLMENGNILETVTIKKHPVIGRIKEAMKEGGALVSLMSGSGPSVFGIFDDEDRAEKTRRDIKERRLAKQVFLTGPYNPTH